MRPRRFIALAGGAVAAAVVALALAGAAQAQAQAVTVERIDVVRPGAYEIRAHGPKLDEAISTGSRVEVRGYKILQPGTQIAARAGTIIGAELTIVGTPRTPRHCHVNGISFQTPPVSFHGAVAFSIT